MSGSMNMTGFQQPSPFASLQGYGNAAPVDPRTGGIDWAATLMPTISSVDTSGMDMGMAAGGPPAAEGGFMQGLIGTSSTPGWGGMALGAASGLANAFMAMKQYGIAKDTLNENKRQFGLNYDAQKQTTNMSLEDRQRARVASNPGAYQSVGSYMSQNRIGG